MSTEQSAGETQTAHTPVDITQQTTNPAPKTRGKNPKRVAAGKLVAERTRVAREQQKKAAAVASVIIANNNAKQQPPPPPPPPDPAPTPAKENSSPLTITQWLYGLQHCRWTCRDLLQTAKPYSAKKKGLSQRVLSQTLPPKVLELWIKHFQVKYINMKKVDIPQVLISLSAIFGISLVWYDFNVNVFQTVRDLLSAMVYDKNDEVKDDEVKDEDKD